MKEAFVERKLDDIQPGWRDGEDITAETKQKIREYVASKMPDEFKDDAACLTDYSIRNMATKIRERENLPKPKRTNKGNAKDAVSQPPIPEPQKTAGHFNELIAEIMRLAQKFSLLDIRKAIEVLEKRSDSGV
jgi:hypothetical protein